MKSVVFGVVIAAGCAQGAVCAERQAAPAAYDAIIAKHARANGVPESLIRRIIVRESRYNPSARNGGHYGMMQIKPATAKSMGYQGDAAGLLDADTNLTYGVRYLAGAYKVAGGNESRAVGLYASGYYYDAKRKGMLADVGMGRDGKFRSGPVQPATTSFQLAAAEPAKVQSVKAEPVKAVTAQPEIAAVPLPPVRDVQIAASTASVERKPSFLVRQPAKPAEAQIAAVSTPAVPSAPLPPVRGVMPAVVAKAKVPAAPVAQAVASAAVPLPRARNAETVEVQTHIAAAPPKRVIGANAQPVLASAGPTLPMKPRQPSAPSAPALGFASDPDMTGSIGTR
ncbi:transglycosylase SLT domain-containing protein [Hansschlegelia quercus]|uniref:lytic transglycosylase domain-containing protein n=1 Tax=Hansschlegelia quercus TaxID=2528245 RepID=UPI001FE1DC8C|nr:lytic transglycosylase domain-containing protein [Hansschlegelia quercus]